MQNKEIHVVKNVSWSTVKKWKKKIMKQQEGRSHSEDYLCCSNSGGSLVCSQR